jgi:hypothetical protein
MFILGHLGLGSKLVSPWAARLPRRELLLGTLLPDLIDKPLYYGLSWLERARGAELGLISGTRTFGHTAVLLLAIAISAYFRRSPATGAIALGMATHLALDGVFDSLRGIEVAMSLLPAMLWPFLGRGFPVAQAEGLGEHLSALREPVLLGGEAVGVLLLGWDFWKSSHRAELAAFLRDRRAVRIERRKRRQAARAARR